MLGPVVINSKQDHGPFPSICPKIADMLEYIDIIILVYFWVVGHHCKVVRLQIQALVPIQIALLTKNAKAG